MGVALHPPFIWRVARNALFLFLLPPPYLLPPYPYLLPSKIPAVLNPAADAFPYLLLHPTERPPLVLAEHNHLLHPFHRSPPISTIVRRCLPRPYPFVECAQPLPHQPSSSHFIRRNPWSFLLLLRCYADIERHRRSTFPFRSHSRPPSVFPSSSPTCRPTLIPVSSRARPPSISPLADDLQSLAYLTWASADASTPSTQSITSIPLSRSPIHSKAIPHGFT